MKPLRCISCGLPLPPMRDGRWWMHARCGTDPNVLGAAIVWGAGLWSAILALIGLVIT